MKNRIIKLYSILEERILVLDGAMGTMIQNYNLEESDFRGQKFVNHQIDLKGNNDILCLTKPDIIKQIHREYLLAGADIIETNTFNANKISQADYNVEDLVYEINFEAAKIARQVVDECTEMKFVAGSIGPSNKMLSMSPDVEDPGFRAVTFDEVVDAYLPQIRGLLDGGADILLVETIFDTLMAKAVLYAIQIEAEKRNTKIPIMVSGTIDKSGRVLSGQTIDAFIKTLEIVLLVQKKCCRFYRNCPKNRISLLARFQMQECQTSWENMTKRLKKWGLKFKKLLLIVWLILLVVLVVVAVQRPNT